MKVPVSWLRDYVDFDDSVEALCDKLTFSGIEVEGVETIGGDFVGIVVGEVTSVGPHPNADRLRLCMVNTGSGEIRVVCGAPNVEAGGKYPFAPVGTTLPGGMKLKKAKIRGEVSEGMLCAEDELGLSESHEGLMTLDASLTPGTPMAEVLGPPETVLDLEITPNRPDSLSLMGVAREVAALCGGKLKRPDVPITESGEPVDALTSVDLQDPTGCTRYTARVLQDVKIGPAPDWMQKRLTLAGIRPINNVVDITNYVMLESGHPLHAFDKSLLAEGRIVIRKAAPGETMHTLDEQERMLEPDMVVIGDANRGVAVAGVMGGLGSEIRDETSEVLLESAHFDPTLIRSTSRRLTLSTDSSYRFERGVDVMGVEWASRRAASLMQQHAGATLAPGVIDVFPSPPGERTLTCRYERTRTLIGVDIPADDIQAIFHALEMEVISSDDADCTVSVPSFRGDLAREVDLIEEVARVYGLDRIPAAAPRAELVPDADDSPIREVFEVRGRMVGLGLREVMNYTQVSPQILDLFGLDSKEERVVMPNPLSMDQSVLRTSLVPQVVESLGRNANRQIRRAAFFEIGKTYHKGGNGIGQHREVQRLAVGLLGPAGRTGIDLRREVDPAEMFLAVKGVWEALATAQHLTDWCLEVGQVPGLREGYAVRLTAGGRKIGILGLLDREIARTWRVVEPMGVLEIELDVLTTAGPKIERLQPVPIFPSISRDIALLVDTSVSHRDVLEVMARIAPKELENVELFDIFDGEGIAAGKKSLAYSFSYRSAERTLTDEEANRLHEPVESALQNGLNAELRGH